MPEEQMGQEGWTKPDGATGVVTPEKPQEEPVKAEEAKPDKPVQPQPKTYTEDEYKGLQRTLNKMQRELDTARSQGASVQEIREMRSEVGIIKGALELLVNNAGKSSEDSDGVKPLSEQYKQLTATQRQQAEQAAIYKAQADEAMADIKEMAEDAGLELGAPELAEVWKAASPQAGLRIARRVTSKLILDKQAQALKKAVEDATRKQRRDLGLDSVDTETPAGKRGSKKPSLEELRKTPAAVVKKKYDSGEWADK